MGRKASSQRRVGCSDASTRRSMSLPFTTRSCTRRARPRAPRTSPGEPCKTLWVRADPPEENIAMWRPMAGVVCIRGTTNRYAVDPNGETIVGMVTAGAMLARRRGQRHILRAGEACIWDASSRHTGSPYGGRHWAARMIVIESPALDELLDERTGHREPRRQAGDVPVDAATSVKAGPRLCDY